MMTRKVCALAEITIAQVSPVLTPISATHHFKDFVLLGLNCAIVGWMSKACNKLRQLPFVSATNVGLIWDSAALARSSSVRVDQRANFQSALGKDNISSAYDCALFKRASAVHSFGSSCGIKINLQNRRVQPAAPHHLWKLPTDREAFASCQ